MSGYRIFSGTANIELSQDISTYLSLELSEARINRFSDGEINMKIKESVRGKDVFIIQSTSAPANDNLMELLIMTDALSVHQQKQLLQSFLILVMRDKIEKQSLEFLYRQNWSQTSSKKQG